MAGAIILLAVSSLLLQIAGGKDYFWQPNSNWGNPSNWALGRVPACGEIASLASVPNNSVVYVDTDTTIKGITLPANGKLVFGPSVTVRFSSDDDTDCTVPGNTQPMAAPVENEFIGATTNFWECSTNWLTEDNFPAEHPPCGADTAVFDMGSFSFVDSKQKSISVRALRVRGEDILSGAELDSLSEFIVNIDINSECGNKPELCPCPNDVAFCGPSTNNPTGGSLPTFSSPVVVAGQTGGDHTAGLAVGIVIGLLALLVVIVLVVVLGAYLYIRYRANRPVARYIKDDLIEEQDSTPPAAMEGGKDFDNPIFSNEKVDLSIPENKPPGDIPVPPDDNQYTPFPDPLLQEKGGKEPKLNKYERF